MQFQVIDTSGIYNLPATFSLLSMGQGDPCLRFDGANGMRLALLTPEGPAAVILRQDGEQIATQTCGDGGEWLKPHLPAMLGIDYQPPDIREPRALKDIAVRLSGMRIPRLPAISLRVVQIILQQLISYRDACAGWRQIVHRYGSPVPRHDDLWFPPTPAVLRRLASHEFIECGVLPQHGRRIVEAMRHTMKIEAAWQAGTSATSIDRTCDFLSLIPGIGPWTVGFLRGTGLGDSDAEVRGDYGHPKHVSYFFNHHVDADDEEMLRLLEPYRPHRFYVLSLLINGTPKPPRRGPRGRSLRDRLR